MEIDIFGTTIDAIFLIFIVAVSVILGFMIVGGKLYPMIYKLNPNSPKGITGEKYLDLIGKTWEGTKIVLSIIIAFPIAYVIYYLFFKKEYTSVGV